MAAGWTPAVIVFGYDQRDMVPGIQQRDLVARDGTRIGYQVRGEGPCIVFANGLGGTYIAFRYLYDAVDTSYKTICWDYRGMYTTAPCKDPRANTIAHQVHDLIEILDAEKIEDFVVVGWSMGVQVGFETLRHYRDRVRGLMMMNGTYGRALQTVMGSRFVSRTIPMLLRLIKAQAAFAGRATKRIAGSDALIAAVKRVGLVSQTIDQDIFRAVAAGFQNVDMAIYSDLLTRLDEHDAEDLLATIRVPVSIVSGDRDLVTPPSTAEHLHRTIPGSRLVMIQGGTHYTPIEYPAIVVEELGRLLDRVPGWERRAEKAVG
jgi:pimeloyl-ACP methyl ester carboxylesterase